MLNTYTDKDIIKLDDLQAIKKNPSMYIGDTTTPTRLVFEVLDNALDEIMAGYASKIEVTINNQEHWFSVCDNGRGFPFNFSLNIQKDPPVLASTQISTSGKFTKGSENSPYKIASGLHGIGLTAVNALSKKLIIISKRDKVQATYTIRSKNATRRSKKLTKNESGTCVTAYPKVRFFDKLDIDIKYVKARLELAKIEYPQCTFILNGEEINATLDTILKQLVPNINKDDWLYVEGTNRRGESYQIWFTWDFSSALVPKVLASVNTIYVHQGIHVNKLYNSIRDIFIPPKNKKYQYNKDDVLAGFRSFMILKIIQPAFDAQVKVRLEARSDISLLNKLSQQVKQVVNQNISLYQQLTEQFNRIRLRRNSTQVKKTITKGSTKFTRLKDCLEPGGELLIGEGESAVSSLQQTRDIRTQAILPLRGVVPNAITMPLDKLLKNDVVKDLVNAIGTGIYPHDDISKIRYNKILIATDADPAGRFIAALLVMMFVKLMPSVIKENHLYLCKTPLYGTGKNKTFKPLWTKDQVEKAKQESYTIRRFKGLGEFNPPEIFRFTFGKERRLYQVQWHDDMLSYLEELFALPAMKRKLLEMYTNSDFEKFVLQ